MRCAVSYCGNNNRDGNRKKWRYFHFPKDEQQLKKWVEFCDRNITNTTTACICNEHFTPEDFERNMQYELGFTRKNPTKLKPGSCPTINEPKDLLIRNKAKSKRSKVNNDGELEDGSESYQTELTTANSGEESVMLEECDDLAESKSSQDEDFEIMKYINDMEEYPDAQLAEDPAYVAKTELAIIDPLNPQTNAEEHVEIIDSESDSYSRHLEIEVSRLKREVFFLKDDRKKLIDTIQNLRATVRNARLKQADAMENLNATKTKRRTSIKKTVMLYTANIETIRKLRRINKSAD